ncbi:Mobile element protein [Acidisarcina polymorpha]|uniref:Mobile element protein n=1 Tax=Acidisarcina polymorpha TaxID=2211140 RepID=A0A2Z5FXG2_9BACT|nr:Mobile element protein [Acidisarcina polymorpha]
MRLCELAASRVRYGYRRLTVLLKREGWEVNAKCIYRIYIEEGLIVRTLKRKQWAQRQRVPLGQDESKPRRPNFPTSCGLVPGRVNRKPILEYTAEDYGHSSPPTSKGIEMLPAQ